MTFADLWNSITGRTPTQTPATYYQPQPGPGGSWPTNYPASPIPIDPQDTQHPGPTGAPGAPGPPGPRGPTGGRGSDAPFGPQGGALAAAFMASSSEADQAQTAQNASSPGVQRMTTAQPSSSMTGDNVWVTVPVDKIMVAQGKGTATPVYASAQGYQSPQHGDLIPPVTTTGTRG